MGTIEANPGLNTGFEKYVLKISMGAECKDVVYLDLYPCQIWCHFRRMALSEPNVIFPARSHTAKTVVLNMMTMTLG